MILVDAGALIEFLRTKDAKLNSLFRSVPVAVCGVTRAEVLAGARGDKDRQRLLTFLGAFQQASIPDSIWDVVGENLSSLLAGGITVPFPDAVLATIANEAESGRTFLDFLQTDKDTGALKGIVALDLGERLP